jgi:hypothetical protein
MKPLCALLLTILVLTPGWSRQKEIPTIRAEVKSAFVWGEDSPSGAVSSSIQDPLTGHTIHRLTYGGVEVSSRMGFEGLEEGTSLLNYSITVVNSTGSSLTVRYGGITVDGRLGSPLLVVPPGRQVTKNERMKEDVAELKKMHCVTSGFLPVGNLFSAATSSKPLTVSPGTALTVSSIIRDPRSYHSILCSVGGCSPTGTMRYYLTVGSQDYVFVWPGRSAIYCGK